ncbi:MAG: hypothetical protein IKS31_03065 [Clostridia bacterium]|nr:hypothetical protein [Clostridia bacterium]MBR4457920.1 hypothetical protein [Clostridia bacterium]
MTKKRMLAALALSLALLMTLTVSAEPVAVTPDSLIGDWNVSEYEGMTISFGEDGIMRMTMAGQTITYRWIVQDGALYLGSMTCEVDGGTMTLALYGGAPEESIVLTRDGEGEGLIGTWRAVNNGVTQEMTFSEDGTVRAVTSAGQHVYADETTTWILEDGVLFNGVDCVHDGESMIIGLNGSMLSLTR